MCKSVCHVAHGTITAFIYLSPTPRNACLGSSLRHQLPLWNHPSHYPNLQSYCLFPSIAMSFASAFRLSRALDNWERLVRAAELRTQDHGPSLRRHESSTIPGFVPSSLGQAGNIDDILQVANEIQAENPNVARILCEHAYSLSQSMDPNSEGRGVLQFKTGLMSIIKQKLAKKDGEMIDRTKDIAQIQEFYKYYRNKSNLDELQEQEERWKTSGAIDIGPDELERRNLKSRKVYTTLRVLKDVVDALAEEASPEEVDQLIPEEMKKVMESDAAKTGEYKAYNILPLDSPGISDVILFSEEVKAAVNALDNSNLPSLPNDFEAPQQKQTDIFDVLQYIFGFQEDNTKNQREHLVLLLANAQSRIAVPKGTYLQLDESAINKVCEKVLDNYNSWCEYLQKKSLYASSEAKERKLLLVSLYLLIWGEAANVRFLPECICYIFHKMTNELLEIIQGPDIYQAKSCKDENGSSFLNNVISPVYVALAAETAKNGNGKKPHSVWRNYDDFNEYFWSPSCFELQWPWEVNSPFFSGTKAEVVKQSVRQRTLGKCSFVEHRTFFHLYHSFHRLWIFLVLAFQALTVLAFQRSFVLNTVKELLSLGPTFVIMKFFESIFDVMLMAGAYKHARSTAVARIFIRFFWFGACSGFLTYLYILVVRVPNNNLSSSFLFKVYGGIVAGYLLCQFFIALLLRVPLFRVQTHRCDHWGIIQFLKWMHQEQYYVGRRLYEKTQDYLWYVVFWVVILACKFSFSYFVQIKPLVNPTRLISSYTDLKYSWHDFFSKGNHNALTIASLWGPVVMIYLLDISIWYTVFSSIVGALVGARERLGEIRSLEMLRNQFENYPAAFVKNLQPSTVLEGVQGSDMASISKVNATAASFAPFWNEIIVCLREEDYINNREKELLIMPPNKGSLTSVQWPLFLLVSKVFLAVDLAAQHHDNQTELWDRVKKDEYMCYAVEEVYMGLVKILHEVSNDEAKKWVDSLANDVRNSIQERNFTSAFVLRKLPLVLSRISAFLGLLGHMESSERASGAVKALLDFYDVVTHDIMSSELRKKYEGMEGLAQARKREQLFSKLSWPSSQGDRNQIKRIYQLLTIKESAANVPKNLEAQRRLEFFANSLFMNMPKSKFVRSMRSFSVFTPYYSEDVMYTKEQLQKQNEDGIAVLFYLQKIFPDEWRNFLERVSCKDESMMEAKLHETGGSDLLLELRLWASYRGQTLARTVRGMMYYRRALTLQTFLERGMSEDVGRDLGTVLGISSEGYRMSRAARAQADLKFTYVVTCQIYGQQKQRQDPRAADILYLMQKNEALRVAFIDTVETMKHGKVQKDFFSKLVKADVNGKDQEIYTIRLPGDPKLGEGKPENQNHAIVFTRGDAVQTIDMNQDNYFEEALKMRNLLEEFGKNYGLRRPSILGVREHVFTGSVSSLASFMSNQETSFVTLGQRVLATPLKVRMHYGHPDVFDRIFHITRGGISKASRVINISEDIFAGFNSTLRQGNITHHEYIQVGKGRDVGLNQIAMFEGKVAGGNGEQSLSRDVYRLGQLFDFFRMLSFYVTSVGYYVCTMMTVLTVYVFLYGKAYLALSGIGSALETRADVTNNIALQSALDTQFLLQIGVFTAIPMVMGFILEQGVFRAVVNFVTMQLQLCSIFFTFSLGTRTHYFGRTILHGGAKYRATGRGFVVQHIKFAENYRLYSRSHFVKALEIVILLLVYLLYGFERTTIGFILLSFSSWFLAISWLFAPFIFNPAGFEWQKTVEDFSNWTNWLFYKGGVGVKGEESWETWWEEEQEHIYSGRGRILETILSLRFFFFQYGIVYKLNVANNNQSLSVFGFSWLVIVAIVLLFKIFTFSQKASVNFQMFLRLVQGTVFVVIIVCLVLLVTLTKVSVGDLFTSFLAFLPTGWAILCIAIAWKPLFKRLLLWKSIRAMARFYDSAMGLLIFIPIAMLSWLPFVSVFQTRLLYNQAFSRGLEISLILAGNQPNSQV